MINIRVLFFFVVFHTLLMFNPSKGNLMEARFIYSDKSDDFKKHLEHIISKGFFVEYSQLNPLSANFTKWLNTLKQFVGKLPTNCLSVFHHFVELALKGLKATALKDVNTNESFVNNICFRYFFKLSYLLLIIYGRYIFH